MFIISKNDKLCHIHTIKFIFYRRINKVTCTFIDIFNNVMAYQYNKINTKIYIIMVDKKAQILDNPCKSSGSVQAGMGLEILRILYLVSNGTRTRLTFSGI